MMSKEVYLNRQKVALGNRIKYLRIYRGYNTQHQFAIDFTGRNKRSSLISRMEKGVNLDFTTLVRLARALKIQTFGLFDFDGQFLIQEIVYTTSLEESVLDEATRLGRRIRRIRKNKGIIQLDVALESLIGDTKISHYERGEIKPEFETIASIALGLKVEIWELFDYKGKYSQFK